MADNGQHPDDDPYPAEARITHPETLALYKKYTEEGVWALNLYEMWWRDHQCMLTSHGYLLRPRFRPGWVPSWIGTDMVPGLCEDSYRNMHEKTIDATRMSDGMPVFIKQIPVRTPEISIAQYLTREEMIQDPMNHCIPILDRFCDVSEPNIDFVVMPVLRRFDSPPFFAVSEVIEFIKQTLEGLVFMHSQGVAHRDCSYLNIMMDATNLYPEGFHPGVKAMKRNGYGLAKALRRCDAPAVKYYFTDFGISTRSKDPAAPRLVTGRDGLDQDVPELSDHTAYDPFAVDIFVLGNLYKQRFLAKYTNLSFLTPLTTAMTQRDPNVRPTAEAALAHFSAIVSKRHGFALRWRLRSTDEKLDTQVFHEIFSTVREGVFIAKQLLNNPLLLVAFLLTLCGSVIPLLHPRQTFAARLRRMFERLTRRPA